MTARELLDRLVVEVPLDAEPAAEGRAAEPFDLPDPRPGPLDSALGADLRRRLRLALDALPPAASALVRLRYGFAASGLCWSRAAIAGLLAWTSRGSRGSKPRPWRTCAARCSNGRGIFLQSRRARAIRRRRARRNRDAVPRRGNDA